MTLRAIALGLGLVATLSLATPLFADDIKLKSGETLTDVEVIKKDDAGITVRLLDGKTRRINAGDIAEHVEKPTPAQEMETKLKDLRKAKNVPEMLNVAKWGFEKGAKLQATKLLNEILGLDKENEEAHKLLGHEKLGGKWLSGKAIADFKAKEENEKKKAMGWVEVGGKWVDPYTAKVMKAGLVEVEGFGYATKDEAAKLAKGMKFVDGQWYEKTDEEHLAKDERMDGGKWFPIADLDKKHKDMKSPWVIESRHFEITTTQSLKSLRQTLDHMESCFAPMQAVFGDAPVCTPGKKLKIRIGPDGESYRAFGGTLAKDGHTLNYSNSTGVFYSPEQKAAYSYYYNEVYMKQWTGHGAALTFMGEIADFTKLPSPMLEAFGAYFEAFDNGKYEPSKSTIRSYIANHTFDTLLGELKSFDLGQKLPATKREETFATLGVIVAYFVDKHPDELKEWMPKFLKKGASYTDLVDAIAKKLGKDPNEEFQEFAKAAKAKK